MASLGMHGSTDDRSSSAQARQRTVGHQRSAELRVVVMGPSGSGKTTIGEGLARRLGLEFVDGDSMHPARNRQKMASGQPLDDADRAPWLDAIGELLATRPLIVACSALKRRYRDRIRASAATAEFLELRTSEAELSRRMRAREHFMPAGLLRSQLDALEPLQPDEAGVVIANDAPVDVVIERAATALRRRADR